MDHLCPILAQFREVYAMTIRSAPILIGIIAASLSGGVAASDLLLPVPPDELRKVQKAAAYFLKKHLYFAKRHRIVTVDIAVLENEDRFDIPLFDGMVLTVEKTIAEFAANRTIYRWVGRNVDAPYTVGDLMAFGQSLESAEVMYTALARVSITGGLIEYDRGNDASFPYYRELPDNTTAGLTLASKPEDDLFFGFVAKLPSPGSDGVNWLLPLEMGGNYHLLFEVDHENMVPGGDSGETKDPAAASKRQKYNEFMDALGEDPRRAMLRERDGQ
jgi:hypothetical protein